MSLPYFEYPCTAQGEFALNLHETFSDRRRKPTGSLVNLTDPTILLVENDDDSIVSFQAELETSTVRNPLTVIKNVEEAVDFLSGNERYADRKRYPIPFVILLALTLRGTSSLPFLEWLRKTSSGKHLPVILLTTLGEPFEIERARALGINSFLTKPVRFRAFVAAVRSMGLNVATTTDKARPRAIEGPHRGEKDAPVKASHVVRSALLMTGNKSLRQLLSRVLEIKRYRVQISKRGWDSLQEMLGPTPPALLVVDLDTLGMSVEEFVEERMRNPALAHIRVIALTDRVVSRKDMRASVSTICLPKPIPLDSFLDAIDRFV